MEELDRDADKFFEETAHFERIIDLALADPTLGHISLALAQAKRVRRSSTLLVQHFANMRDKLQPGGTS